MRNDLAHQYFWDRAVQFTSADGQVEMISELRQMQREFESLDDDLEVLLHTVVRNRGQDLESFWANVERRFQGLISGVDVPHSPERVPKQIEVVSAEEWRSDLNKPGTLVLVSREGRYLVTGERGLCYGPRVIPPGKIVMAFSLEGAFPAVINPRPKVSAVSNYGIPLAGGFVLRVATRPGLPPGQFLTWIQRPRTPS